MHVIVHWHWYGRNRYGLTFYDGNEFMFAKPISHRRADQLVEVEAGANHGS